MTRKEKEDVKLLDVLFILLFKGSIVFKTIFYVSTSAFVFKNRFSLKHKCYMSKRCDTKDAICQDVAIVEVALLRPVT